MKSYMALINKLKINKEIKDIKLTLSHIDHKTPVARVIVQPHKEGLPCRVYKSDGETSYEAVRLAYRMYLTDRKNYEYCDPIFDRTPPVEVSGIFRVGDTWELRGGILMTIGTISEGGEVLGSLRAQGRYTPIFYRVEDAGKYSWDSEENPYDLMKNLGPD